MPKRNLIFDIGVNEGEDSSFYLEKGFTVVGVEANPVLADRLRQTFRDQITRGQYSLVASGIWSEARSLPFYINLDNDHWSSFDKAYGARDGSKYREHNVECVTISSLLGKYGVPYYMKIDVEGADKRILRDLRRERDLPEFISVEEYGVQAIDDLRALGYSGFKIVPQRDKRSVKPPAPALEGRYVDRDFSGRDSGLFGRELPGQWISYESIRKDFTTVIRKEDSIYIGPPDEWHDIHASLEPQRGVLSGLRRAYTSWTQRVREAVTQP